MHPASLVRKLTGVTPMACGSHEKRLWHACGVIQRGLQRFVPVFFQRMVSIRCGRDLE